MGSALHLQWIVSTVLNWQGIPLSLSFSLWVVNLTHRIRMQFKSKFKREYCFPSGLCCPAEALIFSPDSPTISKISAFSFLRFTVWGTHPSALGTGFPLPFGGHSLCHISWGVWRVREPKTGKQVCEPPHQVLAMLYKCEPQAWAVCFRFSLRGVFRLWGVSCILKMCPHALNMLTVV